MYVALSGAAIILGSFLPWVTVDFLGASLSTNGTDGDGVVTLVLGFGVIALAVAGRLGRRGFATTAAVLGSLSVFVAVIDVVDVLSTTDQLGSTASVGVGLWLTLVASAAAIVFSFRMRRDLAG